MEGFRHLSGPARAFVCVLASLVLLSGGHCPAAEFRGIWVDAFGSGFLNTNEVTRLVDECRKCKFNAVLVEMRKRGDAFYFPKPPNTEPRSPMIASNFDALGEVVRQCHQAEPRIEVHCWLVSHFVWSAKDPPADPQHVLNVHPEFLTRDSIGQKWIGNGYYLDPGNPAANQWIHDVAMDVASRYDIDGLHWDYCRYPSQDSGYNEAALRRYKAECGATANPEPNDPRFSEWRRRQVTEFVRWADADLWALKPALVISASVFANTADSVGCRFADWPGWTREGLIDIAMPMNFTEKNDLFEHRASDVLTKQGSRAVYLGYGAYKNTAQNTLQQVKLAHALGFPGTVFYDYRHPSVGQDGAATFRLVAEHFSATAALAGGPRLPWKTSRGIVRGTIAGRDSTPGENVRVSIGGGADFHETRTEAHGGYAFFDLKPGKYEVSTSTQTNTIMVDAGQVVSVDFHSAAAQGAGASVQEKDHNYAKSRPVIPE